MLGSARQKRRHLIEALRAGVVEQWRPVLYALATVIVATAIMLVIGELVALNHVGVGYVVPVMIAATRWGVFSAIVAVIASVCASAFFFYPPIYSLKVYEPQELVDILMFMIVAIVTGQLATRLREHVEAGQRREAQIKALYLLTRRLAAVSSASDIYAAIQDHLSAITGCRVYLFEAGVPRPRLENLAGQNQIPAPVTQEMLGILENRSEASGNTRSGEVSAGDWIIRPLLQRKAVLGVVGIELSPALDSDPEATREQIDAAFAEAVATLERIDVTKAISEARLRAQADLLRDALIGSVSHELRTPLAAIMGPISVLLEAPPVAQNPRLFTLASLARDEAERLDSDIQNLLDASRISTRGVQARLVWTEATDLVNAAIERRRARLLSHRVETDFPEDLPLLLVDPVLIEQALGQIIDNAAKYSPPDTRITISVREEADWIVIAVKDEGIGLSPEERDRICERFYRGSRHGADVGGSGLGLWIARSFVEASGGLLEAHSGGIDQGTSVAIRLPMVEQTPQMPLETGDE